MLRAIIIFSVLTLFPFFSLKANLSSVSGNIGFIANGQELMSLSSVGLGIGISASSNLSVNGNSIITGPIIVGGSATSNSNLQISGTIGYSHKTFTASGNLDEYSINFVDTVLAGNSVTLTLPHANINFGKIFTVKVIQPQYQTIIRPQLGTFIDDRYYVDLTASANSAYPSLTVISDGENWKITSAQGHSTEVTVTSLANVVLWLDTWDRSTIISSNGNVSQWNDKSGYSNHAIQPSGTMQPYWNGANLLFDGNSDGFTVSSNAHFINQDFGMIAIVRWDSFANNWWNDIMSYHGESPYGWQVRQKGVDTDRVSMAVRGTALAGDTFSGASTVSARTVFMVSALRSSVGNRTLQVNGTSVSSITGDTGTINYSQGQIGIGLRYSTTATGFLTGSIYELIYLKEYNVTSVQKIEGYLAHKWGLTSKLPTSHPHKYIAPW